MNPADYVIAALRTEYTPDFVRMVGADATANRRMARLLHAVLGLMSEVGEIADALKKVLIYGKDLDLVNLVEEHADESWYMALLIDAVGSSFEESWAKNIAKLRARFPDKFTQEAALHRDLAAERRALEGELCGAPTGTHGRDDCAQTKPCTMHGPFTGAAALNNVAGAPYRTAPTAPPQRHRETPPNQRHGFVPYVPCESCNDSVCLTIKTLQFAARQERDVSQARIVQLEEELPAVRAQAARKPCDGNFRTAEDYRDHLPCNDCNPPARTDDVSSSVYAMLKAEIAQLSIDNNRLRAREAKLMSERDSGKRRAERHGCNVVDGDPDCG